MELILQRSSPNGKAVLGTLTLDGCPECDTLESTAVWIPAGVYSIEMTFSPHFQRMMPLVDGVVGRTAIRIHPGDYLCDTDGCILVGTRNSDTTLDKSRDESDSLNVKIAAALGRGERVTIGIKKA